MPETTNDRTTMKQILIRMTLVLASVLTLGYTRAAEPFRPADVRVKNLDRILEQQLNRHLSYPYLDQQADQMVGEVFVSFAINAEGKVEVLDCQSENAALRAYVLRKLARIDVGENPDGIWKTTHLHLVFKPQA